jgi:beta-carotene hydroxylase
MGTERMHEQVDIGRRGARLALALPPSCDAHVAQLSTPDGWRFSAWTLCYLGLWGAGLWALTLVRGQWLWQLLLSLFLGNQLHALTILQHDCGHRSAYASAGANLWVGRVLAWFVLMPFTTFTELHRRHHGFLGQRDKDPDDWFYGAGRGWMFVRECCFMPRFIYLSLTLPFPTPVRRAVALELAFNLLTLLGLWLALLVAGHGDMVVFGLLLPMLLLACVYNPISRGYEHYPMASLPEGDARREDLRYNTVTVSSRLIGLMWANINYHVEHHMHPRVPFHALPALHRLFAGKAYLIAPYPLCALAQPAPPAAPSPHTHHQRTTT